MNVASAARVGAPSPLSIWIGVQPSGAPVRGSTVGRTQPPT